MARPVSRHDPGGLQAKTELFGPEPGGLIGRWRMAVDGGGGAFRAVLRVMHRFNADAIGVVADQCAVTDGIDVGKICLHVRPDKDAVARLDTGGFGKRHFRQNANPDHQHIGGKLPAVGQAHMAETPPCRHHIFNPCAGDHAGAGLAVKIGEEA